MTVRQLFFKRLSENWKYQYGVLRTAVDWTVALYIIIPFLVFIGYQYVSWWHGAPDWIIPVPYAVVVNLLFLFTSASTIRLFVEEGDQLFLMQHSKWFQGVMKLGLAYSVTFHFGMSVLTVLVLAPLLLLHYQMSLLQAALLGLFTWCMRSAGALARNFISSRFSGWKYWMTAIGLFAASAVLFFTGSVFLLGVPPLAGMPISGGVSYGYEASFRRENTFLLCAVIVLLGASIAAMAKRRSKCRGGFFHDVEHERKQRMKLAAILLTGIVAKKTRSYRRRRPLLFRNSNLLFKTRTPSNALAELCVKSFFRDRVQVRLYLQFVAYGTVGLILLPVWMKPVICLALALLLSYWLKSYWKEVGSAPFVQMFPWTDRDKMTAASKAVFLMMLPGFLLLSVVAGFSAFSWLGALAGIPVGWIAAYGTASIIAPW
jgi:ABC-2 type transport system permease protein